MPGPLDCGRPPVPHADPRGRTEPSRTALRRTALCPVVTAQDRPTLLPAQPVQTSTKVGAGLSSCGSAAVETSTSPQPASLDEEPH